MKSSLTSNALLLLLLLFFFFFFFFFFLFLTPSKSTASSTNSKHGIRMDGKYITNTVDRSFLEEAEVLSNGDELTNVMTGVEICTDGDEECLRRRIISEAHLDYIYTQQEKP